MPRKRANGEGSIRKRENGTWEARIQLGNDPVTGKPIRKSVYAKTQKEARSKLQELIEKKKSQNYNQVEDDKLTLDTWLDMWLNSYLVDIKPNTILQYESVVRLHIKPALGSIPLKRLRTPMIQEFYNNLQKNGLSSKFIKNIHGVLHRALDMAVRVEYLKKNEQRNGGAGTEGRYRAQQRADDVRAESVKPAQDLPAALRREIALDVGDQQDQHTQQHHDLDGVVQEELNAPSDPALRVQSGQREKRTDQSVQPLHSQHFILNEIPNHVQQHPPFSSGAQVQRMLSMKKIRLEAKID